MVLLSLIISSVSVQAFYSAKEGCETCGTFDSELVSSYTDKDGNFIEVYEKGVEIIYYNNGDVIINDYNNVFGGTAPVGVAARISWVAIGKAVFTAIGVCSAVEYVTGHDVCRIVLSQIKEAYLKMGVEYEVSGNFVPGYIPGCEPRNSGPCNAGYWRYQVNEV